MKRHYLVLLLVTCAAVVHAQIDEKGARKNYLQAEESYLQGRYVRSLALLQDAEHLLGRNTPKIQLLRVLIYEKLVDGDMEHYEAAVEATTIYLNMASQLPPLHRKYIPIVQEIQRQLPARKRLADDRRWKHEARIPRIGFSIGLPGKDWIAAEWGIIIGKRSRFWAFGLTTRTGEISEEKFYRHVTGKLSNRPMGTTIKKTLFHIGYFQGIRVLPRHKDFIKPFFGARALYDGTYSMRYISGSESIADPGQEIIDNIQSYGLHPDRFFHPIAKFEPGFSFDVVIGLMAHLRGTTFMVGTDLINSKIIQVGVSFKTE